MPQLCGKMSCPPPIVAFPPDWNLRACVLGCLPCRSLDAQSSRAAALQKCPSLILKNNPVFFGACVDDGCRERIITTGLTRDPRSQLQRQNRSRNNISSEFLGGHGRRAGERARAHGRAGDDGHRALMQARTPPSTRTGRYLRFGGRLEIESVSFLLHEAATSAKARNISPRRLQRWDE